MVVVKIYSGNKKKREKYAITKFRDWKHFKMNKCHNMPSIVELYIVQYTLTTDQITPSVTSNGFNQYNFYNTLDNFSILRSYHFSVG